MVVVPVPIKGLRPKVVRAQATGLPLAPPPDPVPGGVPSKNPKLESAKALKPMKFDPVKYVVPNYIAEGLTILAGKPKVGKSWFALDAGLAVGFKGTCFDTQVVEQGDVLALCLEDNLRRLRSRISKILGEDAEWPERFHFATEWPRAEEGGLAAIRAWIKSVPNPRLVIVDVLAAFRSARGASQGVYDADYAAVKALQRIATFRRKIDVFGSTVSGLRPSKDRRAAGGLF
jgi:AAA domain